MQVTTNVGKSFLNLLEKHFPKHHKLHKIINRNCVKVSYSCLPNMSSYISSYNIGTMKKSRQPGQQVNSNMCNCHDKSLCPLNKECQIRSIIYNASIKLPNESEKRYIGLVEPDFKGRYRDHVCSFNNRTNESKTNLSKAYWEAIDNGHNITSRSVEFSILKKCHPYRMGAKKCDLCLWEKLLILKNEKSLVNERDEFISKCRHTNKFMLQNFKT